MPAKKEPDPPKEPQAWSDAEEVAAMSCETLLEKIKNAVGSFTLSICGQRAWHEEDIELLGKCARILTTIKRGTEEDTTGGIAPGTKPRDVPRDALEALAGTAKQ